MPKKHKSKPIEDDEMSDSEMWKAIREEKKAKRADRRETFTGGPGWVKHCDTHWSYMLLGNRLDYWPGTMRFRWRGKTYFSGVKGFIGNQEYQASQVKEVGQSNV